MTAAQKAARMRQVRDGTASDASRANGRNGLSQWQYDAAPTQDRRRPSIVVSQWERDSRPRWRRFVAGIGQKIRRNTPLMLLLAFTFLLGFSAASGPQSALANLQLRERLRLSRNTLTAREGELELTRLELTRLNSILENSRKYHIPADLAGQIYDVALAEGIDPKVAFSLVSVESDFVHNAVSPVGARGLTQLMPSTARFFDPKIDRADLFDPETNLHIGFRFLKELIQKYNGNIDRALSAYNRGPAIVDKVVEDSGDPSNGYSDAVLRGAQ